MFMSMKLTRALSFALMVCWLFLAPGSAKAQGGEVLGYFGGATVSGGVGSHPALGVAVGANTNRVMQLFAQLNYVPTGSGGVSGYIVDFGGGLELRFRIPHTKVAPYGLATIGLGHAHASAGNFSASDNSFFYGLGGGFRYYVGRNWGLRPELRFQKYTGQGRGHLALYTVGVFYQF
jgi:hypothetical protein